MTDIITAFILSVPLSVFAWHVGEVYSSNSRKTNCEKHGHALSHFDSTRTFSNGVVHKRITAMCRVCGATFIVPSGFDDEDDRPLTDVPDPFRNAWENTDD